MEVNGRRRAWPASAFLLGIAEVGGGKAQQISQETTEMKEDIIVIWTMVMASGLTEV